MSAEFTTQGRSPVLGQVPQIGPFTNSHSLWSCILTCQIQVGGWKEGNPLRLSTGIFILPAMLALVYFARPIGGASADTIRIERVPLSLFTLENVPQGGRFLVRNSGVYTQFERRGWASEYWSGEVIQNWNTFDSVVGSTVAQEVSLQLDKMKALGVNTITFELRTADPTFTGNFVPPDCNEPSVLGLQFPQPTAAELSNLPLFFDLAREKSIGEAGVMHWISRFVGLGLLFHLHHGLTTTLIFAVHGVHR